MIRHELLVEHRRNNHFLKSRRFRPSKDLIVIGTTRYASVRLLGSNVAGVHASIEFRSGKWILSDLSSTSGTWVNEAPIVEYEVDSPITIRIGDNEVNLFPRAVEDDLFDSNKKSLAESEGPDLFHQVVRRFNGQIIETLLLRKDHSYHFQFGLRHEVLPAPKSLQWVSHTFGSNIIQQRLVKGRRNSERQGLKGQLLKKGDTKAVVVGLLMFMFIVLLSQFQEDQPASPVQPDKNKITQMIYDAKVMKKRQTKATQMGERVVRRKEQREAQVAAEQKQVDPNSGARSIDPKKPGVATSKVVINKINALGLSQLVGKISDRASRTKRLTGSSNSTASTGVSSLQRNIATFVGDQVGNVSGSPSPGGAAFGGVGTKGKGGGSTEYRVATGLAGGGVGSGVVESLDEETIVEGGLDREVIAKYIESNLGQIRYCYERQLSGNPTLYGKLRVKFIIGPTGAVIQQQIGSESTLKNALVEGCVLRNVSKWKFPTPQGGTQVVVTYPFLFRSTN